MGMAGEKVSASYFETPLLRDEQGRSSRSLRALGVFTGVSSCFDYVLDLEEVPSQDFQHSCDSNSSNPRPHSPIPQLRYCAYWLCFACFGTLGEEPEVSVK